MKKFFPLFLFSLVVLISCNSDDDDGVIDQMQQPDSDSDPEPDPESSEFSSGAADFSNFVSVGNSLTAGFSDNALFIDGQTASFPNMMATSFSEVGGGTFNIPFMADNLGGATFNGVPIFGNRLIFPVATGSLSPTPVEGTGTTEISNVLTGPFNNMGVPGATSYQLVAPGYGSLQGVASGSANPYYARFATSATATVLQDAEAQNPSFFSLWIGNNDILGFATSGGVGIDQNGNLDPSTYGGSDITDPNLFANVYDQILQTLTAQGAKGVIANLPDVTTIPFFTTTPYNPIPLDAATASNVNSAYAAYNDGLAQAQTMGLITSEEMARRTINFSESTTNAVVIIDEDLTDLTAANANLINMRQATADDLLILTAQAIIGTLADPNDPASINGIAIPLADMWVLTPEEQEMITVAASSFNQTIAALAAQYDVAFFDANAYLNLINSTGVTLSDGSTVTSAYISGGGFSLDGVHPSPRGYALIANQMLEAIEAKYDASLPKLEPLDFTGLYLE